MSVHHTPQGISDGVSEFWCSQQRDGAVVIENNLIDGFRA